MIDFTRQLSISGMLSYLKWRVGGRRGSVTLRLKSGKRISLCRRDYGVAYEIFVHEFYRQAVTTQPARLIVDLGANVGYSCIYFLERYPHARLIAFEPHPHHIERLKANLALNNALHLVTLYPNAASNRSGQSMLSDLGASSSTMVSAGSKQFAVDRIDVFPLLLGKKIDILKMDIEGGEYEILSDDRLFDLDVKIVIMEWHRTSDDRDDRTWCVERLQKAGYRIENIFTRSHHGMFCAFKTVGGA
jgi:FkbM family methyltransferase